MSVDWLIQSQLIQLMEEVYKKILNKKKLWQLESILEEGFQQNGAQ